MISDPILCAVARGVGLHPAGDVTDQEVSALIAGDATITYGLDPASDALIAMVVFPNAEANLPRLRG